MIARVEAVGASRLFPTVSAELLAGKISNDIALTDQARGVLGLAGRPLSRWQRWRGTSPVPAAALGRILFLMHAAVGAECQHKLTHADFYWGDVHDSLRRLDRRSTAWDDIAGEAGDGGAADAKALRRSVLLELLADTHLALINGWRAAGDDWSPNGRCHTHAERVMALLARAGEPETVVTAMRRCFAEAEVECAKAAERYDQAIEATKKLRKSAPDDDGLRNGLAGLYFSQAMAKVSDTQVASECLSQALALGNAAVKVEQLRTQAPYEADLYDYLALLHHLRAIKLSNGENLPEALVASAQALTHDPELEAARDVQDQLTENMNNLLHAWQQTEAQLRMQPNAQLNEQGKKMRSQARKGFTPAQNYFKDKKTGALSEARTKAQARRLWRNVGLAEPVDQWLERAERLSDALVNIVNDDTASVADRPASFSRIAREDPLLADLDHPVVRRFIRGLTADQDDADTREDPAAAADEAAIAAAAKASDQGGDRLTDPATGPQPLLSISETARGGGLEPIGHWLFGRDDKAVKAFAFASAAALVAVVGLTAFDLQLRQVRAEAFDRIQAAARRDDDKTVRSEGARFLAAKTFSPHDERVAQVAQLMKEAAVAGGRRERNAAAKSLLAAASRGNADEVRAQAARFAAAAASGDERSKEIERIAADAVDWSDRRDRNAAATDLLSAAKQGKPERVRDAAARFAAAAPESGQDSRAAEVGRIVADAGEWPNRRVRNIAVKDLEKALARGGNLAAMDAAARFIEAPPVAQADPRRETVVALYAKSLVDWFQSLSGDLSAAALRRIQRYRSLTNEQQK